MWKLSWILDREKKTSSFYFNVLSLSEAGHLLSEPTCDWLTNVAIKSGKRGTLTVRRTISPQGWLLLCC